MNRSLCSLLSVALMSLNCPSAQAAGGLPNSEEILAASKGVQRTAAFSSDLFGDGTYNLSPAMTRNMTASVDLTGANGWETHRSYVRVIFGRFLTEADEASGNWTEFSSGEGAHVTGIPQKYSRNISTGGVVFASDDSSSPLIASDGHFLKSSEPFQTFQVDQFYGDADLGDFFNTCIPFEKGRVQYLICRQLSFTQRALQKIRYEILARISDDVPVTPELSVVVADQIERNQVPSNLIPIFGGP